MGSVQMDKTKHVNYESNHSPWLTRCSTCSFPCPGERPCMWPPHHGPCARTLAGPSGPEVFHQLLPSWGCQNKQPFLHYNRNVFSHGYHLKSRYPQGHALSEASRRGSLFDSSSFWHCQHPWCSLAGRCITPTSASIFTQPSPHVSVFI